MSHEPNLKLVNGLRFQLDSALETIAKFLTANFYKKFKENKVVFQFKRNLSFLKLLDAFFIHFDNLINLLYYQDSIHIILTIYFGKRSNITKRDSSINATETIHIITQYIFTSEIIYDFY